MNESINIKYISKTLKSVFGGQRIEVIYTLTHVKHGRVNKYNITCEIAGIESHNPYLRVLDAEFIGDIETDSNDETLTTQTVIELFESAIE